MPNTAAPSQTNDQVGHPGNGIYSSAPRRFAPRPKPRPRNAPLRPHLTAAMVIAVLALISIPLLSVLPVLGTTLAMLACPLAYLFVLFRAWFLSGPRASRLLLLAPLACIGWYLDPALAFACAHAAYCL